MLRLIGVEYYRAFRNMIIVVFTAFLLVCALTNIIRLYAQGGNKVYIAYERSNIESRYIDGPEGRDEAYRYLWHTIYAQTFSNIDVFALLVPGLLSFTVSLSFRKRRISEMIAAGNGRTNIFLAQRIVFCSLVLLLYVVLGSLNFWINTNIYRGHVSGKDWKFILYTPLHGGLVMMCYAACWLPITHLFHEPVSGFLGSAVYVMLLRLNLVENFVVKAVDSFNHPSPNKLMYFYAGGVSPEYGQNYLLNMLVLAAISIIIAWLLFRWRRFK